MFKIEPQRNVQIAVRSSDNSSPISIKCKSSQKEESVKLRNLSRWLRDNPLESET